MTAAWTVGVWRAVRQPRCVHFVSVFCCQLAAAAAADGYPATNAATAFLLPLLLHATHWFEHAIHILEDAQIHCLAAAGDQVLQGSNIYICECMLHVGLPTCSGQPLPILQATTMFSWR